MRKQNFKGRCTKVSLEKCKTVCKTYDPIQLAYANVLNADEDIVEIRCNVLMDGLEMGEYMTDFVCVRKNGDLMVRECVYRRLLTKPMTVKLLDASKKFWNSRGIYDWGLVYEKDNEE